jgi:hypothetical protein
MGGRKKKMSGLKKNRMRKPIGKNQYTKFALFKLSSFSLSLLSFFLSMKKNDAL